MSQESTDCKLDQSHYTLRNKRGEERMSEKFDMLLTWSRCKFYSTMENNSMAKLLLWICSRGVLKEGWSAPEEGFSPFLALIRPRSRKSRIWPQGTYYIIVKAQLRACLDTQVDAVSEGNPLALNHIRANDTDRYMFDN